MLAQNQGREHPLFGLGQAKEGRGPLGERLQRLFFRSRRGHVARRERRPHFHGARPASPPAPGQRDKRPAQPCGKPRPGARLQNTPQLGKSMSTDTNATSLPASSFGDAFVRAGRKDEAAIWFRRALAADPGHVEAACGLVALLLERRSLAEAIETLEACLRRKPFNVRLLAEQRRIGLALYNENKWREAEPWLRKALELESWDENLNNIYARVCERAFPGDSYPRCNDP